ncbi:hypothetical protein MMC20_005415 [Loxospora ochrophaea]|nr:hypothetical protein [Loxospora ochrophaea]
MPNPAAAGGELPDPKGFPKASFKLFGEMTIVVLLVPFLFWYLWYLINHWGTWRIRRNDGRHYIRTWHGWVEEGKANRRKNRRKSARDLVRRKTAWKTTNADYRWVFWDPYGTGQKSFEEQRNATFVRYLPKWLRSSEHGAIRPRSRSSRADLSALEKGLKQTARFRHSSEIQPTLHGPINTSLAKSTGMLTAVTSINAQDTASVHTTQRRCLASGGANSVWRSGSDEMYRATQHQLLHSNENLSSSSCPSRIAALLTLFQPDENQEANNLASETEALHRLSVSETSGCSIGMQETSSGITDLQSSPSQRDCNRNTIESHSSQLLSPTAFEPRSTIGIKQCGIQGRANSPMTEDIVAEAPTMALHEQSVSMPVDSASHRTQKSADNIRTDAFASRRASRKSHANWYNYSRVYRERRLADREGLQTRHLGFGDIDEDKCNLAVLESHRRYACQSDPLSHLISMRRMKTPDRAGRVSPITLSRSSTRYQDRSFGTDDSILAVKNPVRARAVSKSIVSFSCSKYQNSIESKPKSKASFASEPSDAYFTPSKMARGLVTRRHRSSDSQGHPSPMGPLRPAEAKFVDELRRRLDRLHYELSPGFRGPRSNGAQSSLLGQIGIYLRGSSAPTLSWATQADIHHFSSVAGNFQKPWPSPQRKDQRPLESAVKVGLAPSMSKATKLSRSGKRPSSISLEDIKYLIPSESTIDTSAWILKRLPQGYSSSSSEEKALFTGVRGKVLTKRDWNLRKKVGILAHNDVIDELVTSSSRMKGLYKQRSMPSAHESDCNSTANSVTHYDASWQPTTLVHSQHTSDLTPLSTMPSGIDCQPLSDIKMQKRRIKNHPSSPAKQLFPANSKKIPDSQHALSLVTPPPPLTAACSDEDVWDPVRYERASLSDLSEYLILSNY